MNTFSKVEILSVTKVSQLTTLSRSTIYRLIKAGDFPPPISLSANRSGFRLFEIEAWLDARISIDTTKEQKDD